MRDAHYTIQYSNSDIESDMVFTGNSLSDVMFQLRHLYCDMVAADCEMHDANDLRHDGYPHPTDPQIYQMLISELIKIGDRLGWGSDEQIVLSRIGTDGTVQVIENVKRTCTRSA